MLFDVGTIKNDFYSCINRPYIIQSVWIFVVVSNEIYLIGYVEFLHLLLGCQSILEHLLKNKLFCGIQTKDSTVLFLQMISV